MSDMGLDEELDDIMTILGDLQRQLAHSNDVISALQEELAAARREKTEADAKRIAMEERYEEAQGSLSQAQGDAERFMAEVESLDQEKAEASREVQRLRKSVEESDTAAALLKDDADARGEEVASLKAAKDEAETEAAAQFRSLKDQFDKQQESAESSARESSRFEAEIEDLKAENRTLNEKLQYLERVRGAMSKIRTTLKTTRDAGVK
jgi:chromosome segregation ATPase